MMGHVSSRNYSDPEPVVLAPRGVVPVETRPVSTGGSEPWLRCTSSRDPCPCPIPWQQEVVSGGVDLR